MSGIFAACRRVCCGRSVKDAQTRLKNTTENTEAPQPRKSATDMSPSQEKKDKDIVLVNEHGGNDLTAARLSTIQSEIDLDHLAKEYLETINEYRFHLNLPALELSPELTARALTRATLLAREDRVESTNRTDLIHNNQPIGETVMSCRAPASDGYAIAKLTYDELMNDLNNGNPQKKRYTPILNQDCRSIGFGLVRNEKLAKDFIVIYYYPMKRDEELWPNNPSPYTINE